MSADEPHIEVFFMLDPGVERRQALAEMAKLRAAGVACDADYAGRSFKGQRTQLARSGAGAYVHVTAEDAEVHRQRDEEPVRVAIDRIAEVLLG